MPASACTRGGRGGLLKASPSCHGGRQGYTLDKLINNRHFTTMRQNQQKVSTEHVIFSSHCFLVSVFTLSWNRWLPCGLWSHGSGSQVVAKLTFPSTNLCPESNGSIFSLNSLLCVVRFFFFVFFSALTVRESPPQWHLNDDRWAETGVLLFLVSGRLRAETTQTALNSSRVSGRGDRTGNRPWKFRLVLKRTRVLVTRTRNLSVGGQRRTKVMGEEPHLLSHDASRALQKSPSR